MCRFCEWAILAEDCWSHAGRKSTQVRIAELERLVGQLTLESAKESLRWFASDDIVPTLKRTREVLFHGPTPTFDEEGYRVYSMGASDLYCTLDWPSKTSDTTAEIRHKSTLGDAMPKPFCVEIVLFRPK